MPDSGKFKDLYLNSAHTYPCQPGEWGNGGLEWPWVIQTVGRQSAEDPR